MEYMFMPLKRYFDFSGRSRRKEYWMFFIFVVVGEIITMILDSMLGLPNSRLILLSVRDNSVLALRFSMISPPPAMTTGLIRSRRNGS